MQGPGSYYQNMESAQIGNRLKHLRIERGMSQEDLRKLFDFKDRQTISAIETGARHMSAQELMIAIDKLNVSVEYFSDPFRLIGEGEFSWRHQNVAAHTLDDYEQRARRWIAIYRHLSIQVGRERSFIRRSLGITKQSSFEDAMAAGEQFVQAFELGDRPATRLVNCMEVYLDILVLMIEAHKKLSGAACRLPDLAAVLISLNEVEGRRNFNIAHELFHILTWDALPPEHSEEATNFNGKRTERLADNFAGALLMPKKSLGRYGGWSTLKGRELVSLLNSVADELCVTSTALSWRLVSLGQLKRSVARSLPQSALRNNGCVKKTQVKPDLFSKPYMEVLGKALARGFISARRAASLHAMTLEDLDELFAAHNLEYRVAL